MFKYDTIIPGMSCMTKKSYTCCWCNAKWWCNTFNCRFDKNRFILNLVSIKGFTGDLHLSFGNSSNLLSPSVSQQPVHSRCPCVPTVGPVGQVAPGDRPLIMADHYCDGENQNVSRSLELLQRPGAWSKYKHWIKIKHVQNWFYNHQWQALLYIPLSSALIPRANGQHNDECSTYIE